MTSYQTLYNQIKEHISVTDEKHINIDSSNYKFHVELSSLRKEEKPKIYTPGGQTLLNFHQDSSKMIRLLMGAYRSGKSTACCAEIIFRACAMPPMDDGVRRSRWAIIRNTMGELKTTTLNTWQMWFSKLGIVKTIQKPIMTHYHTFNDGHGKITLELIFLGLDNEKDKEKLDSLELTGAYINELQYIPHGIFMHLIGRIGQYPPVESIGGNSSCCWLITDTNPPDEDHWVHEYFEMNSPSNVIIYHQPPGLLKNTKGQWVMNENADNVKNLRQNYYYDIALANNFDPEYIKVKCRGEYGLIKVGKPVFPDYNDDLHSIENIEILPDEPIYIFWDYGLTPAALLTQLAPNNQFRCFKEFTTEYSSVRQLASNWVIPYLMTECKDHSFESIGDPTGKAAGQTNLQSCQEALLEEGLPTRGAITNNLTDRLNAVRDFLNRLINGRPAFILSRVGCPILRKALIQHYCYELVHVIGEEKPKELPKKSHPWSDIADCLEYGALEFNKQIKGRQNAIEMAKKVFSIAKY